MHGRIENQANDGNTNNGQQDATRYFQFFEADNHRQTNQRHNDREGVEVTQRNRQAIQRVLNDQTNTVCRNQQQEQADTNTRTVRNALWQIAQDPATNTCRGNDGKQNTHQKHRAQRNRHANMLPQHQAECGKRRQRNGATNRQRQVCPQTHHNRADTGYQAGCHKYSSWRETGFTQHSWNHDNRVDHRQKRR